LTLGARLCYSGLVRAFAPWAVLATALIVIAAPPTPAAPIGPNHVAVILFNFQNNTSEPLTVAQVEASMFTAPDSTAAYWEEVSAGLITLTGDVYGWFTIPFDGNNTCPWTDWGAAAAAASGVDLSGYDQVVFVSPGVGCDSPGYADDPWSYVTTAALGPQVKHEIGHNFGLVHASRYVCRDANGQQVQMSDTCLNDDSYGDLFDIMGEGPVSLQSPHLSSRNKMILGILSPAEFPAGSLKTVLAPGTFTLAPSEEPLAGEIQTIRVPQTVDAACQINSWYYLEFRQPFGTYFDNFAPGDPVVNGVTIRVAYGHKGPFSPSFLIDTVPGASIDFSDAALAAGQTFSDPVSGVSVQTISVGASGASVAVSPPPLGPDADGDAALRCLDNCPTVANADQADADGDGLGDVCDICTGAQSWSRRRITVTRIADGQTGNDVARIGARFVLATGSFSANPAANGARLQLRTRAAEPALDVTLPGGPYAFPGPGWTTTSNGFTFRDLRPGGTGGVKKMVVKDRGDGEVQISVVVKDATLALLPADVPLQATAVLGGAAAGSAGECGQARFGPCVTSSTSIRCR